MSAALHYRSNLRDLYFNLFEFLDVGATALGRGPFQDLDEDTARATLAAFDRFAREVLAESFATIDRSPAWREEDGTVRLPEALRRALAASAEQGFERLELPVALGGIGAPPSLVWAAFELKAGANPPVAYYEFGVFLARVIDRLGTPAQRARFVQPMIDRHWGGAMVLTEPDAGSDVGAGRTRARHVTGDVWELEGTKRFITNGDYDAAENIVHLVLARPEGAAVGTKGLSMFIVPKFHVNDDGTLGARNGWTCTGIEKKLGIKASVTCEIAYGTEAPCRGYLVGEKHDGIRQMFMVIEQARMGVGVKSMATLSTAYLNALAYAKDRVQGPELTRALDKSSPRVPILRHADVRRMLMLQKSHVEAMRALCLYVAHLQDQVALHGGHGDGRAAALDARNDLLLPLVKGFCSERGFELLTLALQCFGGAGYTQDVPVEQYLRDQKIDSLYEGTTHIQALDLILRKVVRDGGATLGALLGEVRATVAAREGGDALAEARHELEAAVEHVEAIFATLGVKAAESLHHVGLQGNRVLLALAELVCAWLLLRHAAVALARREGAGEADAAFYQGKVASARFFCREVLPGIAHARRMVEASRLDLMELADEAW